ncbi:GHKL domain-containing protein [Chitinophaga rupis]|uniref:GHKL domain-containing protein n=1 Tax=Chitinophaga rupis TaxID=573321 RepID=A0A1H8GGQ7_9BACT|nr:sensor histidine kinase [Chitinophaga rupis]SEN42667.1 GHKL domain-containing protein [Chitinophaga rupis]
MNSSLKKKLIWALIAVCIFVLFLWLFKLGMPEAAFQFATGITAIIMAGLLSGRYAARLWYKSGDRTFNKTLTVLIAGVLIGLFLIGFFVNKMIEHTRFNYFFFTIIALFLVNAFMAIIISLVRYRIRRNIHSAQTALAQSKTELQLMQAQLSPHFLFNTLNNLYGLSLTDHQKVPGLLLKLSDLLRYSVYEAKEVFVPLREEVNYLKNYVEFEKIRLEERLLLSLEMQEEIDASVTIAPMLLIIFLENAFKHSKNNEDEKIFIDVVLRAEEDSIFFSVKNSCSPPMLMPASSKAHSGFGMESVKKRLDLLYPNRHELKIARSERSYSVILSLKRP